MAISASQIVRDMNHMTMIHKNQIKQIENEMTQQVYISENKEWKNIMNTTSTRFKFMENRKTH